MAKKQTKVIFVTGDHDFSAKTAEKEGWSPEKILKTLEDKKVEDMEILPGIYAELHIYGEIDKDFITFIRQHIQDYEDSKFQQFYIME